MLVIYVNIHVKDEFIEDFKLASSDNAMHSLQEPGIFRFDVLQSIEDPARFALYEVYQSTDAHAAHRETAHYQRWRDSVEKITVEPRSSVKFTNIYPPEKDFG